MKTSKSLLMIERMILESLQVSPKNVYELSVDTGLQMSLVSNVISNLLNDNFVSFNGRNYIVNDIQASRSMKSYDQLTELKELFVTMVNSSALGRGKIKLQKVHLTKKEEAILGSYFINIETFIKNVKESRVSKKVQEATGEQRVFVWGEAFYKDLALDSLSVI